MRYMIDAEKLTNAQITARMSELDANYRKLMKVARKLADEMSSLHDEYDTLKSELNKRSGKEN